MPESIENYVIRERRHHPLVAKALLPYFSGWNPIRCRVIIRPEEWWFFRAGCDGACCMWGTVSFVEGWMNKPAGISSRSHVPCDLSQPSNWRCLIHETYHAFQCARDGHSYMTARYAHAVGASMLKSRKLFDHAVIPFERECSRETAKIIEGLRKAKPASFWQTFEKLQ